ncbi:MAG: nucleotidyltransferase family protein [Steroidobacteraceae bacterium]|jgi:molybdenum cofactor cytidylyltransferase|nr:nucleotidyltransferase family protein [Steroidobacteraceae bacterium]
MDSQPESTLHALILAAGASRRFGSPKQLVRIDGRPMLHAVVSRAVEVAGHSVSVVLGAHAAELTPLLSHSPASIVINRDWEAGMASSIRAGLARLPGTADGVLILLVDQPSVTAEDLRRLAGAWRRQPDYIAAAQYGSTTGAPAIFPRWCLRELAELRGDRGAAALLQRHADRLVRVPIAAAALDVDTPEDLLLLERTTDAPGTHGGRQG